MNEQCPERQRVTRKVMSKSPLQPPPSSTPSYSTTIWAALADESVDDLVLSLEVDGAAILLKHFHPMVRVCQVQLGEILGTAMAVDELSIKGNGYRLLMVRLLRLL